MVRLMLFVVWCGVVWVCAFLQKLPGSTNPHTCSSFWCFCNSVSNYFLGAIFARLLLGEELTPLGIVGASLITIAAATNSLLDFGKGDLSAVLDDEEDEKSLSSITVTEGEDAVDDVI